MSQLLQTSSECCNPCPSPLVENIPGPQGPAGADGTNGTNGVNAYTTLTASFVMPAEAGNVTVAVVDGTWMVVGQKVAVGKFGDAAFGTFQVVQVISQTSVNLTNVEDTATGAYADNSPPGTTFPNGAKITPSGVQGVAGAISGVAGGDLAGTYPNPVLIAVGTAQTIGDSTHVSRVTTDGNGRVTAMTSVAIAFPSSGTAAALDAGILDGEIAANDGNLTPGDSLWATANGQETKSAANAKLALGLGILAGAYALLQNKQTVGVEGGTFTSGSWVVVPINAEVSDSSGIVSLAANVATLATGNYRISAIITGYKVDRFQVRLFNISDAAVEFYGSNANADSAGEGTSTSCVEGRLIVTAGPKNYRLEGMCQTTNAGDGFGDANSFGGDEIYASWVIVKET